MYKVTNPTIVRDGNKFSLVDAQMQHVKDSEVSAALKAKQFKVWYFALSEVEIEMLTEKSKFSD